MPVTQYIGSRYVPIFADPVEWSSAKKYEPLTVVLHEGNSFTSKQFVPVGIDIENEAYWALTGNYNAQVEQYRRETAAAQAAADSAQSDIATLLPKVAFSTENTVKKYVDDSQQIVYPEQFGAIGDGVTNDTTAFQNMFNAINGNDGFSIVALTNGKHYLCNVVASVHNTIIMGNDAVVDGGKGSAIILTSDSHDVEFHNCKFITDFDINNHEYSNACLSVSSTDVSKAYEAYNINVINCTFKCGVFGFTADNAANIKISNCTFTDGYYVPANSAGGYHILEQSCTNVNINSCIFDMGKYSRHAIYVSVNQNKPTSKESKNINISNCIFNQSKMELVGNARYSPNTPVLMVRAVNNLTICDCIAYNITGFVSAVSSDGALNNIDIHNVIVDGFVYLSTTQAPSEARYMISIAGDSDNRASVKIYNIIQKSTELKANQAYTFAYCNVSIHDLINEYRIYLAYCVVDVENVRIKYSEALFVSGDEMLTGSIRNITGPQVKLFNDSGLVDLGCIDSNLISHIWFTSNGEVRFSEVRPFLNHSVQLDSGQMILTLPNVANSDISMLHALNRDVAYHGGVSYASYNRVNHTVRLISYHNNALVTEDGHYSYNLYLS